ncbi:MAG: aminotransferase class I/II-fold pyridoxal phosphate-dependent enzyme [Geodermatophilaceae bacterium]|nr:aminotransferase class I/II-fold pyridoxal phosphate-dependent enzyme [Geodermatophilaceae bacterium]
MAEGAGVVDLRSDTLTKPTPGMREALASAEVGDDVYLEDPTVNALEAEVAALFGHEAALFVPTGTMGNQICLRLLAGPGEEVLCDADAHIVTYEHGAAAALFGIQTRTVVSQRGLFDTDELLAQVREGDWHTMGTKAVAVENTHNRGGGTIQPLSELTRLSAELRDRGVALHIDGARIWNAAIASGTPPSRYGALADTMSVCLSKGLGAPVGSVIIASAERIAAARVLRKRLGGGMRQVGILAAAGRYALAHHVDRLADDHARAQLLAARLGISPAEVQTNIVRLDAVDAPALAKAAAEQGVLISQVAADRVRLLTHLDVDDAGVRRAADVLADLLDR